MIPELRARLREQTAAALRDVDVLALPTVAGGAPRLTDPDAAGHFSDAAAIDALADVWPDGGIVVLEAPSATLAVRNRIRASRPGSYYFGAGGGLGFGLSAAIGVQMAQPDRPVVCIVGEGSAQYAIQAFWSAVAYGVPVTFLVLRNEEYAILKRHTVIGDRLCGDLRALSLVRPIVRSHHERLDGSGYPDGLRGDAVPLLAQIMGVVDVFDALTTSRPYKATLSVEQACDVLRDEVRCGWRRGDLVETFIDLLIEQGRLARPPQRRSA